MMTSWLASFQSTPSLKKFNTKSQNSGGFAYFLGREDKRTYDRLVKAHGLKWQSEALNKNDREVVYFTGKNGPVWILRPKAQPTSTHWGILADSPYSWSRDTVGSLLSFFKAHQLKTVHMEFIGTDEQQELGALVGLEMAAYNFRETFEEKDSTLPKVILSSGLTDRPQSLLEEARRRAAAVNVARHLVNLPPNELNPTTFQSFVKKLKWGKETKVEFWNADRLKKEKCNLLLAVGAGSPNSPCLIHIRYRPGKKTSRPIAFVGKGITFDTGGLDIKPSSGMRMMKKDMGGAAAVLGLAWWVSQNKPQTACDFYLALAENSVDGNSMRPSDVVKSRSGLRVEIDNTDAEGRLVLADALDVAVTQKGADEPDVVVDVATLTGAMRVALGLEVGGFFSNDDDTADEILNAAQSSGDLLWRMPLIEKYWGTYSSPFADFKNAGESFGGAITAALFLQKFIKGKKWAHLDVYAWADKAGGAMGSSGGNGQAVQCLIEYLSKK